jgi:glycosyltransferase involved in cell wall biosynthesis
MSTLSPINSTDPIRIGIDATNIRIGGGITHLLELLNAVELNSMGVSEIIVWGGDRVLGALPNKPWLRKINPTSLNHGLFRRIGWQVFSLSRVAKEEQCDVLLVPGGSYVGQFRPVVTMSQNLFPFEWSMIRRVGFSIRSIKFILLRWAQSFSFKRSDGIIFLTQYAQQAVLKVTGPLSALQAVIAHGLNARFDYLPKPQRELTTYSAADPYRLLYVSTVDVYKNQVQVARAVALLRTKGYPLALTLIGPSEKPALLDLQAVQAELDPDSSWLEYLGALPYTSLSLEYQKADLGIFASSCETFGMTVLEKMSAGLPIACSNQSCMQEILADGGLYFDPMDVEDIANTIESLLLSPELREEKQTKAYALAKEYSWDLCAQQTLAFLHQVVKRYSK